MPYLEFPLVSLQYALKLTIAYQEKLERTDQEYRETMPAQHFLYYRYILCYCDAIKYEYNLEKVFYLTWTDSALT